MSFAVTNCVKFIAVVILLPSFIMTKSFAQTIIGKTILDRKLEWSDFEAEADKNSTFSAMTYWSVSYTYKIISFHSDTAIISFQIVPAFQNYSSWVKKKERSDELLQHEQGHYNLAIICAEMLRETFASTIFLKSNYSGKIDSIYNSTLQLVKQIELQYDADTNHMLNRDEQERWNNNIKKLLEKLPAAKKDD